MRPAHAFVAKRIKSVSCATLRMLWKEETFQRDVATPGIYSRHRQVSAPAASARAGLVIAALQHKIDATPMWRRFAALMRFDRPHPKPRPPQPPPAPAVSALAETRFHRNPPHHRIVP